MKAPMLPVLLLAISAAIAPSCGTAAEEPRWSVELKGGRFEPDIDDYERFYGNDTASLYAIAVTYQFRSWLEAGGEIGYLRDSGFGLLTSTDSPGAPVDYTLVPAHAFVNIRGVFRPDQLLVPYVGGGATMAYYRQEIELQPTHSGRTDLGANARLGLQVLLDRIDPRTASQADYQKNAYLFLEGQWFTAEIDDIDLGGVLLAIGFKLEF